MDGSGGTDRIETLNSAASATIAGGDGMSLVHGVFVLLQLAAARLPFDIYVEHDCPVH